VRLTGAILEELVFAIPTDLLWSLISYKETGFISTNSEVLSQVVEHGQFGKRSELEEDPSFKQLIPYAIIANHDSFYLFKRTSGQKEKRLHNKLHLGVGGHMNPGSQQESNEEYLLSELKRELFEEVKLLNGCAIEDIRFIGFINDDSIPVGRMHIGLLYYIRVSNKDIVVSETEKMTAEWVDKSDLMELYEELETWTKIAVNQCITGL
jgi:predicted NUDIX family phosphoesterase